MSKADIIDLDDEDEEEERGWTLCSQIHPNQSGWKVTDSSSRDAKSSHFLEVPEEQLPSKDRSSSVKFDLIDAGSILASAIAHATRDGQIWDTDETDFPDLHELFLAYDREYFGSSLGSVEVKWSKRMTLCAGLCVYHKGGYCSVRLSEPLLKFRSVREFRETLLHEMIHAFLFVTKNFRDHSAHGPEFQSLMRRINAESGLNITIFHNFRAEVNFYRKHVWLCDGPCRQRPPYFGVLRRANRRAPGPSDFWWSTHQTTCGGTYRKVLEPEEAKPSKRKGAKQPPEALSKQPASVPQVSPGKKEANHGKAFRTLEEYLKSPKQPVKPSQAPH